MLATRCSRLVLSAKPQLARNISCCSVLAQKASAGGDQKDLIQQLFVAKIREYAQKTKAGKMPDVDVKAQATLDQELKKFATQFGVPEGKEAEFCKFPSFNFSDSENNIKLLGEEVATLTDLLVQQNISPKETDPVIHKEDPDVPFFDRFRS